MKNICIRGFSGWCMLIKKDIFDEVGFFNEEFDIGIGEDSDFYFRLRDLGYVSYITGSCFIHHFGSKTIKNVKSFIGDDFEKKNIKKIEQKWKHMLPGYFKKKKANLFKFLMKKIYGHTLVERK